MDDGRALPQAVCDHPDDDVPRLAYADWLYDHGDPNRARFIHVQVGHDRGTDPDAPAGTTLTYERRAELRREARELLTAHGREWGRPLRDLGVCEVGYVRGFPEEVWIDADSLLVIGDRLFADAPIRAAQIEIRYPEEAQFLAGSLHLGRLIHLGLEHNLIGSEGARVLAQSSNLRNLVSLELDGNDIMEDGARELADSPYLSPAAKVSALESAGFDQLALQVSPDTRDGQGRHGGR
jgi:uncharacterized protein (TIGR02996 family)